MTDTMGLAASTTQAMSEPQVLTTQPQLAGLPQQPDVHPVVSSVIQQVYADPNVPPSQAAYTAALALNAIQQVAPTALAITRSSPMTALEVNTGIALMSMFISMFFPHPKLSQ